MTNILATLLVLTVTNWESSGTFTDKKGNQFDVVEGWRCTNWTAQFEFEGRQIGFVLKSVRGDKCDEVKNPIPAVVITNVFNIWTNYIPYFTNMSLPTNSFLILNGISDKIKHVEGTNIMQQ